MYTIEYADEVREDLKGLPAKIRREILERVSEQLSHEPTRQTRNRKPLPGFQPSWEYGEPVWLADP